MELMYLYALEAERDLQAWRRGTPEWQHRAAALSAQEPWRHRFIRNMRRLKLFASQQVTTVVAPES